MVRDDCTHPLYASECQGAPELEGSRGPIWFPCLQEVSFFAHLQEGEGQAGGLPSPPNSEPCSSNPRCSSAEPSHIPMLKPKLESLNQAHKLEYSGDSHFPLSLFDQRGTDKKI